MMQSWSWGVARSETNTVFIKRRTSVCPLCIVGIIRVRLVLLMSSQGLDTLR